VRVRACLHRIAPEGVVPHPDNPSVLVVAQVATYKVSGAPRHVTFYAAVGAEPAVPEFGSWEFVQTMARASRARTKSKRRMTP